jgi:hypothetical protein
MKFKLPKDYGDITLRQMVAFMEAKTQVQQLMAITGFPQLHVMDFKQKESDLVVESFSAASNIGTPRHEQTFLVEGMRLGFIPDMDALSLREYIDLDSYAKEIWKGGEVVNYKYLPDLLCILFRPVNSMLGEYYDIDPYNVDRLPRYKRYIESMTMDRVNGALVFFSTLLSDLIVSSLDYLEQEMRTKMETLQHQAD